jgi:hypothetical protein
MATSEEVERFNKFYYPEIKDLTVKFLTLVVSVFTFSIVFADKIVVMTPPIGWHHVPIIISWVFFSIALALGGYGLWLLFVCGEIANGSIIFKYDRDLIDTLRVVYTRLDLSGYAFGIGIILLALSALVKLIPLSAG